MPPKISVDALIQILQSQGLSEEQAVRKAYRTTQNPGDISLPNESGQVDPRIVDSMPPDWFREDGTLKGPGFLGLLRLPNGGVASEFSIADSEKLKDESGQYMDYPSLVPTLTREEIQAVLGAASDPSGKTKIPDTVYTKAEIFALDRKAKGLPLFAGPSDSTNLYPELPRSELPGFVSSNYTLLQTPKPKRK